jgi:acetate kinase
MQKTNPGPRDPSEIDRHQGALVAWLTRLKAGGNAAFVYAMTKYVGAYAAVLGGLDALVFTAGIGENSAPVGEALWGKLAWLGVSLD